MELTIKSEPCETLYEEQLPNSGVTLQQSQPQNNLKRFYEEIKDTSAINRNMNQHNPSDPGYQSFELPSVPLHIQNSFSTHEMIQTTMTSEGKPLKKFKKLETNALFNPPFFKLVKELLTASNKDAIAARCYSCGKIVKGNRGISSNFIKHMKRGHPEVYKIYDGYKTNRIKSYQLPNLAKMITRNTEPLVENCPSGSDSTAANSNDDTNVFFEANAVNEGHCVNDSTDDNEDAVNTTKEISETNLNFEFSSKTLETFGHVIDEKLKAYVKQKDYEQLCEKVNDLTDRNKSCDVNLSPALADLKNELDNLKRECSDLRLEVQRSQASKRQLQNELETVEKLLHQRKLIIKNIIIRDPEKPIESVEQLLKETLHLEDIKIINCSIIPSVKTLMGSSKENVSIELANPHDCKAIFRQTTKLKNTGVYIEPEISPFQRKRKNKLMVLRKELLRRNSDLKVLVRDTKLVVNGKNFYWDDVEGLCHDGKYETVNFNGVEYLKFLSGIDLKEFTNVLLNYNVQIT